MGRNTKIALLIVIITAIFLRYETPNISFISGYLSQNGASAFGHVSSVEETGIGSYVTLKFTDSSGKPQAITDAYYFSEDNQAKDYLYSAAPVHIHYLSFCPAILTVDELHSESLYEIACTIVLFALIAMIGWSFLIPEPKNAI